MAVGVYDASRRLETLVSIHMPADRCTFREALEMIRRQRQAYNV